VAQKSPLFYKGVEKYATQFIIYIFISYKLLKSYNFCDISNIITKIIIITISILI